MGEGSRLIEVVQVITDKENPDCVETLKPEVKNLLDEEMLGWIT